MKRNVWLGTLALTTAWWLGAGAKALAQDDEPPAFEEEAFPLLVYFSPNLGFMHFEGKQEFKPGMMLSFLLGKDLNDRWALEGGLVLAPSLSANSVNGRYTHDWSSTHALGVFSDAVFHFTRWDRFDPYMVAGLGLTRYGEAPERGNQVDWTIRGGFGAMYHFNDEWAMRADFRTMLTGFGSFPNANSHLTVGAVWRWGARVSRKLMAVPGDPRNMDSDGDGISDYDELHVYGTDPLNPDTDGDGLTDYEEIFKYGTNPLHPDSDGDGLTDYEEIYIYGTDPLNPDTDSGGVSDGHEVLEDATDPLDGRDDLFLIRLHIEFDTDKAAVMPQHHRDIEVVALTMRRHPGSTAVIEGHADRRKNSEKRHNQDLSERRARAVRDHLIGKGIAADRLQAVGFGFSRPIAPNDPHSGNRENRRVDVYLRGVDREKEGLPPGRVVDDIPAATPTAKPRPQVRPAPIMDLPGDDK
jgi:outer membrane protein OmpA-like peptidoglycan-associated protein